MNTKPDTNTAERILNALRARKTPLTRKQISAFTRRHPISVARELPGLVESGSVVIAGTKETGKRGRPAYWYTVPQATA